MYIEPILFLIFSLPRCSKFSDITQAKINGIYVNDAAMMHAIDPYIMPEVVDQIASLIVVQVAI